MLGTILVTFFAGALSLGGPQEVSTSSRVRLAPPEPIPLTEVLAIEPVGERRRSAVFTDALEHRLVTGTFEAPAAGDTITGVDGTVRTWSVHQAEEDGWFRGAPFRSGWAWARVRVPVGGAWVLDASGHSFVHVDGEPRAGDVYRLGTTRLPLALAAGEHELLFRCGRGSLRATLVPAPAPVFLETVDRTLPDVVRGEHEDLWLGLLASNATDAPVRFRVSATVGATTTSSWETLAPSSHRKLAVRVSMAREVRDAEAAADLADLPVALSLADAEGSELFAEELSLRVVDPFEKHVRTFVSGIDGSVQYYGVTPPSELAAGGEDGSAPPAPALVLTLHGASVEGRRQAQCYAQRPDVWIVAPTNRRPFGFDWEDWGRLDALEVLAEAEQRFGTDPRRTVLTGHSMGGHGTWQIGAHFPDRFAAIAPSAGWRDFWSYAGGGTFPEDDPIGAFLTRSVNPSRTLLLKENYLSGGVYVLHGDADATVRVSEARAMREELAGFHPNFAYYERAGAGHW